MQKFITVAFKSYNDRNCDSWEGDRYRKSNKEKKQRILRAITLQGAIEKSSILLLTI